jgi:hypothetical protein
MHLFIYAPPLNVACQRMLKNLQNLDSVSYIEYFASLETLLDHLRRPLGALCICILMPENHSELYELNQMRHLLRDIRIILVLPDRLPTTISDGHALRPRYVSYADGHLADVEAVVNKMTGFASRRPVRAIQ